MRNQFEIGELGMLLFVGLVKAMVEYVAAYGRPKTAFKCVKKDCFAATDESISKFQVPSIGLETAILILSKRECVFA